MSDLERVFNAAAKELGDNGYCSYIAVEAVLKRQLLPLLEAGQAMRIAYGCGCPGCPECRSAYAAWDAALKAILEA